MFGFNPLFIIGSILALASIAGGLYIKGRMDCANAREISALNQFIEQKEELDEIRNNKPDTDAVIRSLRTGRF